jgi:polysaccharide pyruvyl transferase WcaK-like protein
VCLWPATHHRNTDVTPMNLLVDAFVDNNLGDDLMLDLLVHRYPHVYFWCLRDATLNDVEPYRRWPNLLVPDWSDLPAILPFMDGLLVFGGSMWQDHGHNLIWYEWRRYALETIKARGGTAYAVGNSIGPVASEAGRRLFAELLSRFDLVTVRDSASMEWFDRHVGTGRCMCATDLVFDYPLPAATPRPDLLGVSVHRSILLPQRNGPYARAMAEAIAAVRRARTDLDVRLFVFDARTENDLEVADDVMRHLGAPGWLSTHVYRGDAAPLLADFARCGHIFASRFHAVVLAMALGIAFTPFDYMGKTAHLLADAGYHGPIVTHESLAADPERVAGAILAGWAGQAAAAPAAGLRAQAGEHFAQLDRAIGTPVPGGAKRASLSLLGALRTAAIAVGGRS